MHIYIHWGGGLARRTSRSTASVRNTVHYKYIAGTIVFLSWLQQNSSNSDMGFYHSDPTLVHYRLRVVDRN